MRALPLALVALAACGRPDAAPPAARDSTAPVAAADSVSAPDSTPAAPPAWVLSERAFGPLRVGMTADEARAALGGQLTLDDPLGTGDGPDACRYGISPALPGGTSVMFEGSRVVRIDVDSASATALGAHVGISEAEALRLYPTARVEPHHYVEGHYLIVIPGAPGDTLYRIVFETDSSGVTGLRGGLYPAVEYVEGCA